VSNNYDSFECSKYKVVGLFFLTFSVSDWFYPLFFCFRPSASELTLMTTAAARRRH